MLSGRPAYSGSSSTYPAGFDAVSVNLGATYSNQDVRIRFRVATDTAGFAPGIEIRHFATSGLANTPFTALVAHSGVCPTTTSISSDKNPSNFGDLVTFGAGVSGGLTVPTGTVTFKDGATTMAAQFSMEEDRLLSRLPLYLPARTRSPPTTAATPAMPPALRACCCSQSSRLEPQPLLVLT